MNTTSPSDRMIANAPALLAIASALVVGTALFFEHGLDYAPCKLCHWQRIPYYMAIGLFIPPLIWGKKALFPCLLVAAGLFFTDAGIAGFHMGVEFGWWEGPTTCSANALPDDPQAALDHILNAALIRCDEIAWSFLGLSMAGWNMLIAAGLGTASLLALSQAKRKGLGNG